MIDFVVIGGGIAGVSAAAHLAPHGSVVLLEKESQLAYHTTGRSAAMFVVNYGVMGSRPLVQASEGFFVNPPEGFADFDLLTPRGLLWIASEAQMPGLEQTAREGQESGAGSRLLSRSETLELQPILNPNAIAGGLLERNAREIDVSGLHQGFVRLARAASADIRTDSGVVDIERRHDGWEITAASGRISTRMIINASGAWGDEVAILAGARPVGLTAMRRTAFMVDGDERMSDRPMVVDADQRFYVKPDGAQLLCSLAEENPSPPEDARPRMEDVALAIERINESTTLGIRSVNSQWTGLRTFAPDRDLVCGEDPDADGFFWLVGQGGTGIQNAPAYGALIAALATGGAIPDELSELGFDTTTLSPARFRSV